MANIIDAISKSVRPYYYVILLVVILIIFIIAGYYGYRQYVKETQYIYNDVANANTRSEEVLVYLFHVDWCPHCVRAMPSWNSFKQKYDGKEIGGYKLNCIDVDCTKEDSTISHYINKYDIDSYPTVKMIKGVQTISFDASVTNENLSNFVEMTLNEV